ncbi:MAG TPA: hypothetical protein VF677_00815, partial [Flavobacterium sp.]
MTYNSSTNIKIFFTLAVGVAYLIFQSFTFTTNVASQSAPIIHNYLKDLNKQVIDLDKIAYDFEMGTATLEVLQK